MGDYSLFRVSGSMVTGDYSLFRVGDYSLFGGGRVVIIPDLK